MFRETRRFASPGGALLAYHYEAARGQQQGVLLICHGMVEHSLRYWPFAVAMSKHGFHVYAHDHRGHGETTAPDAPRGRFADDGGADQVISDVKAMADLVTTDHPGLALVLFGHSMGGLLVLNTIGAYPQVADAAAIWNANFNLGLSGHLARLLLAAERMFKGSDVPSAIMPRATFDAWAKAVEDATTPQDWLSRDRIEVAKYIADPLCGFDATVSMWLDIVELSLRGARLHRLAGLSRNMPLHLVGGGKDPSTRNGADIRWLAERLRGAGFRHVTCRIHDGMRHETLNELGREEAIEEFADWSVAAVKSGHRRLDPRRSAVLSQTE